MGWGAREFDKAQINRDFPLGFWAQCCVSVHTTMHSKMFNTGDIVLKNALYIYCDALVPTQFGTDTSEC